MDTSGKIRTEAEGREARLPYLIEFLRQAKIEEIITCGEDPDGRAVVSERKLIATFNRSDVADAAQTQLSSLRLAQGVHIR